MRKGINRYDRFKREVLSREGTSQKEKRLDQGQGEPKLETSKGMFLKMKTKKKKKNGKKKKQ